MRSQQPVMKAEIAESEPVNQLVCEQPKIYPDPVPTEIAEEIKKVPNDEVKEPQVNVVPVSELL